MLNFRFVRKTSTSKEVHNITAATFQDAKDILVERVGEEVIDLYHREMLPDDFSEKTLRGGI